MSQITNIADSNDGDGPPRLTLRLQFDSFSSGLGSIPAIMESPVEEVGLLPPEVEVKTKVEDEAEVEVEVEAEAEEEEAEGEEADELKPLPHDDGKETPKVTPLGVQPPSRGATDPGKQVGRRKPTLRFFGKREKSASFSTLENAPTQGPRSFAGLRSVVGTISRSKTMKPRAEAGETLLGSLTLPSQAQTDTESDVSEGGTPVSPVNASLCSSTETQVGAPPISPTGPIRQPLSPTMHSRGSILNSAAGIKDDESRRLSEMAFLL